jgi:hypothetical protein
MNARVPEKGGRCMGACVILQQTVPYLSRRCEFLLLRLSCVFGFFFRHLTLLHRLAKKLSFKITSRLRSKACHAREVPLTPPPFNLRKSKKLPVQLRFEMLQPACAVPQHAAPDCWIGHSTGAPVDSANIVIPAPQQAVQADSKELIN